MEQLDLNYKHEIKEHLFEYCRRFPSRNIAANSLMNVSSATVSNILNNHFDSISDNMFLNLAYQVGAGRNKWHLHESIAFKEAMAVMADAQQYKEVSWIIGDAGCGKTTAARTYFDSNKNVYYILCSEDIKKTDFVHELARCVGVPEKGYSIREIFKMVISTLTSRNKPLLILDEADKLTDTVLNYFITIYNYLSHNAGIILFSTSYMQKRLRVGLKHEKKGYREINSRIGRCFFELTPADANDIHAICRANGIIIQNEIAEITKDVEKYEYDLRRLRKVIHSTKRLKGLK